MRQQELPIKDLEGRCKKHIELIREDTKKVKLTVRKPQHASSIPFHVVSETLGKLLDTSGHQFFRMDEEDLL